MERQSHFLRLLLDVTQSITASLNTQEVFDLMVAKIPEVIQVDAATIRLLDASGKKLVLEAASGLSDTYLNRGPIDAEKSVLEALAGNPIAIADAANDTRIQYPEAARRGRHSQHFGGTDPHSREGQRNPEIAQPDPP